MKTHLLPLLALVPLCGCKAFDVQTDPETGLTHIVDAETGEGVGTVAPPADAQETDPTGLANAAGALVGAVTGNPGTGAAAGVGLSWLLALLARRKKT